MTCTIPAGVGRRPSVAPAGIVGFSVCYYSSFISDMHKNQGGEDGVWAHFKQMMGISNVAEAHGNMRNPATMMYAMPGMGAFAGGVGPDIEGLLSKAGKPVTQHVTNVGAINMYNNIYDAENPARVIMRLTNKALRQNLERPDQSSSTGVYR